MRGWKESGEVPNSEDENDSWDDLTWGEGEPTLPTLATSVDAVVVNENIADAQTAAQDSNLEIWEIPSSPADQKPQHSRATVRVREPSRLRSSSLSSPPPSPEELALSEPELEYQDAPESTGDTLEVGDGADGTEATGQPTGVRQEAAPSSTEQEMTSHPLEHTDILEWERYFQRDRAWSGSGQETSMQATGRFDRVKIEGDISSWSDAPLVSEGISTKDRKPSRPFLDRHPKIIADMPEGLIRSPTPSAPKWSPLTVSLSPQEIRETSSARVTPEISQAELSRQVAVRAERSLRPRKPIQEHPYLLEGAQYAKVMKSHGFRPLRVVVEDFENVRKRQQDKDSQEQDFVAEDEQSQERTEPTPSEPTEESQGARWNSNAERLNIWDISSSPPETSPQTVPPQTSSQPRGFEHTDATSLSSDDGLPSLDQLLRSSAAKTQSKIRKRGRSSKAASAAKRLRVALISSSPPRFVTLPALKSNGPAEDAERPPSSLQDLVERPSRDQPAGLASPLRPAVEALSPLPQASPFVIDLETGEESAGAEGLSPLSDSDKGSSSDSEDLRLTRRRIRGVLPASWLRLDQGRSTPSARVPDAVLENLGERSLRRGVALPKASGPGLSTAPLRLFDDDEDGDMMPTKGLPSRQHAREPSRLQRVNLYDGASAEEEDSIDFMLPGRKRRSHTGLSGPKKRTILISPCRQPRITEALGGSRSAAPAPRNARGLKDVQKSKTKEQERRPRAATPPRLSILDVVEPAAPAFVKIAARTARRKPDLGKHSPGRKLISFANRQDNVDALSALRDWKVGKIKPRFQGAKGSAADESRTHVRKALQETCSNMAIPRPHGRPQAGFNAPEQDLIDGHVMNASSKMRVSSSPEAEKSRRWTSHHSKPSIQPAQLEELIEEQPKDNRGFTARKRILDLLYRKSKGSSSRSTTSYVNRELEESGLVLEHPHTQSHPDACLARGAEASPVLTSPSKESRRPRRKYRKQNRPMPIDLSAPQYLHANDPLPVETAAASSEFDEQRPQDRLKGLGAYGTHYTQHFEVFPFEHGVYFDATTIIGQGFLKEAADDNFCAQVQRQQARISFTLDQQRLQWGTWNATTSSQFGVLVDWIGDKLFDGECQSEETVDSYGKAVEAARFVLDYVVRTVSFQSDADAKTFTSSCLDVFESLIRRSGSLTSSCGMDHVQVKVLGYTCVCIFAIYRISQSPQGDCDHTMRAERLLAAAARALIEKLLSHGLGDIRALLGDLQRSSCREQRIRAGQVSAMGWVIAMRVLEKAAIPESGFWDITQAVLVSAEVSWSNDAQILEAAWRDFFTLLPLTEMDDDGVLVRNKRRASPMEGWVLPQQLMKPVFQLYRRNARQPPGFNNYCRALVARCHHLLHQWGWRRCNSIIGTIFDFFGSQKLAHLRNEEVYTSPNFLHDLCSSPSLLIEPEDCCFHIFVKMLALAIRRLRELGMTKDIRNMVARVLPNNNAVYLKENYVRQVDLAALRNHHDLLCTLFWACPRDLRPPVRLIERLVAPGSSHKEACLINLGAWTQIARFVVSCDESHKSFAPFHSWINAIFHAVLGQYLSVDTEMEQQFRALSAEAQRASRQLRDKLVVQNKASAMDLLASAALAALDVLQHAASLETAVYALNTVQLQKAFTVVDPASAKLDGTVVHVALDTLRHFLDRVDRAAEEQFSSNASADSKHMDEAIQLLDERLAKDFFALARTLVNAEPDSASRGGPSFVGVDKVVVLAARLASRFIDKQMTRLPDYFTPGAYTLFSEKPQSLSTPERRYLPLFIATLVQCQRFNFKDIGCDLLGLWMLCIVKPARLLKDENRLAETLKQSDFPYLQGVFIPTGASPDYATNRDYFLRSMHHMRASLREGESTQTRRIREDHAKILATVMARVKQDLGRLRPFPSEHGAYIEFVRQIVAIVKSHGVGICRVDDFFTRPSPDYSPSVQDPQLHVAGRIGYGVRLDEKDSAAVPQLFHCLFNDFEIHLANGKLADERSILEQAAENPGIFSFILQYMLPAVIKATSQTRRCWLLLDSYVAIVRNLLTRSAAPREVSERNLEYVLALLTSVAAWLSEMVRDDQSFEMSSQSLHVAAMMVCLANAFQPCLKHYLYLNPPGLSRQLHQSIDITSASVLRAIWYLCQRAPLPADSPIALQTQSLPRDLAKATPPANSRVDSFCSEILSSVADKWIITWNRVKVRMGGARMLNSSATTSSIAQAEGTKYVPWDAVAGWQELKIALLEWHLWIGLGRGLVEMEETRSSWERRREEGEWEDWPAVEDDDDNDDDDPSIDFFSSSTS